MFTWVCLCYMCWVCVLKDIRLLEYLLVFFDIACDPQPGGTLRSGCYIYVHGLFPKQVLLLKHLPHFESCSQLQYDIEYDWGTACLCSIPCMLPQPYSSGCRSDSDSILPLLNSMHVATAIEQWM